MDETEIYDACDAHFLEEGDMIVHKDKEIVLDAADDLGDVIRISWRDEFDEDQTDDLDPHSYVSLWRYV